jgi:hypothetical protein
MMMLMIIRKISSGHHGCIHFLKQASLFNASFMLMLIRANAICTAWIAWTVPFVLFVFHSTVTIELFRYVQSAKDFIHHSYKVAIHTHKHCSHHEALFLLPEISPCLSCPRSHEFASVSAMACVSLIWCVQSWIHGFFLIETRASSTWVLLSIMV